MSNIGIPTWVFQLQPRNSEAREPTSVDVSNPTKSFELNDGLAYESQSTGGMLGTTPVMCGGMTL